MKIQALWHELVVDTQGFHKQNPPLMKLAAATIVGHHVKLVEMKLHRLNIEVKGTDVGVIDGSPLVTLQHVDDDALVWETTVEFPQMQGFTVWAHTVDQDILKITFVKDQ